MKIITNNVPRQIVDEEPDSVGNIESYVIYKGEKYPLEDFMSVSGILDSDHPFRKSKWDGYLNDTHYSGILLKWVPGTFEEVVMGRFCA